MADLTVAMNGIEVGRLSMDVSGAMSFRYLDSWCERPGARASRTGPPAVLRAPLWPNDHGAIGRFL